MRISDWSSDVCSSDLLLPIGQHFGSEMRRGAGRRTFGGAARAGITHEDQLYAPRYRRVGFLRMHCARPARRQAYQTHQSLAHDAFSQLPEAKLRSTRRSLRSEEHTSELQSLMRISYDAFCRKKKIISAHTSHLFANHYINTYRNVHMLHPYHHT